MRMLSFVAILLMASILRAQTLESFQLTGSKYGLPETNSAPMTLDQAKGQALWFMMAPNSEYHTRTFPQRLGGGMNFWQMFRADQKYSTPAHLGRWELFGSINDPDCCAPGKDCQEKIDNHKKLGSAGDSRWQILDAASITSEKTFGLDYCLGDEKMFSMYDGKKWNVDSQWEPACRAPFDNCALQFGQPTGVVGFRKFPNPRFDAAKWAALNGKMDSWSGWEKRVTDPKGIQDESVQPPYNIGMACTSCHVNHNPVNPAKDPSRPEWNNLLGAIGGQFTRSSEIHVSALGDNNLLRQVFRSRPGVTDTSGAPHDYIYNPGSMLAIINLDKKPTFPAVVRGMNTEVHRILKGGEDSTGIYEAIQRVYLNIGTCAEQCWVNKLTDTSVVDPTARNYGQIPFNPKQCAQNCAAFAALTADTNEYGPKSPFVGYIAAFLTSRRPTDLEKALASQLQSKSVSVDKKGLAKLLEDSSQFSIESHGKKYSFEKGDVNKGAKIFSTSCARCHSTQHRLMGQSDPKTFSFPTAAAAYWATDKNGVRKDFLGNDELTPFTEAGTNRCRSLHSNHMKGHIWQYYSSDTYKDAATGERPDLSANAEGNPANGGRGYYRNISLLSLWATAPYLHNNAVGPEVCGEPGHPEDLYRFTYNTDGKGELITLNGEPAGILKTDASVSCVKADPSVNGRLKMALASLDDLLNPSQRLQKVTKLDKPLVLPMHFYAMKKEEGAYGEVYDFVMNLPFVSALSDATKASVADFVAARFSARPVKLEFEFPAGTPVALLGNLQFKNLIADIVKLKKNAEVKLEVNEDVKAILLGLLNQVKENPGKVVQIKGAPLAKVLRSYSMCTDIVENKGHEFGADLNAEDKRALMAFLLTL